LPLANGAVSQPCRCTSTGQHIGIASSGTTAACTSPPGGAATVHVNSLILSTRSTKQLGCGRSCRLCRIDAGAGCRASLATSYSSRVARSWMLFSHSYGSCRSMTLPPGLGNWERRSHVSGHMLLLSTGNYLCSLKMFRQSWFTTPVQYVDRRTQLSCGACLRPQRPNCGLLI